MASDDESPGGPRPHPGPLPEGEGAGPERPTLFELLALAGCAYVMWHIGRLGALCAVYLGVEP